MSADTCCQHVRHRAVAAVGDAVNSELEDVDLNACFATPSHGMKTQDQRQHSNGSTSKGEALRHCRRTEYGCQNALFEFTMTPTMPKSPASTIIRPSGCHLTLRAGSSCTTASCPGALLDAVLTSITHLALLLP